MRNLYKKKKRKKSHECGPPNGLVNGAGFPFRVYEVSCLPYEGFSSTPVQLCRPVLWR